MTCFLAFSNKLITNCAASHHRQLCTKKIHHAMRNTIQLSATHSSTQASYFRHTFSALSSELRAQISGRRPIQISARFQRSSSSQRRSALEPCVGGPRWPYPLIFLIRYSEPPSSCCPLEDTYANF